MSRSQREQEVPSNHSIYIKYLCMYNFLFHALACGVSKKMYYWGETQIKISAERRGEYDSNKQTDLRITSKDNIRRRIGTLDCSRSLYFVLLSPMCPRVFSLSCVGFECLSESQREIKRLDTQKDWYGTIAIYDR